MHVLVQKMLIIKFNGVNIDKVFLMRAGGVKHMMNYKRPDCVEII